ncbi:MAG: hypothetical protein ACXVHN_04435 [Methanobacterium sp.]
MAFGAVIAAGIHGIKEKMKLEEPVQENLGLLDDIELKNRNISLLQTKLGKDINKLENDIIILESMGKNLSKAYLAVKKAELDALENLKLEEEVKLLVDKYW